MTVTLKDHRRDNQRGFDTRAEAEEKKNDLIALGASPEDLEIVANGESKADGGTVDAEVVEHDSSPTDELPDNPDVSEDPVEWLPSHFIDTIQGVPTVNRKGYAVIASQYDIDVTADPVVRASETDFEYAEFEAIAITEDGRQYSGFGSAHVDRQDGDDPYLLSELAETRAMKRAVAWASGVGLTAMSEMRGEL